MAIFRFVDAIANDRPIDIYGTGAMCRDFTYIDDLVGAVDRLIKIAPVEESRVKVNGIVDTLSSNAPYRVVNIGGGDPASAPSAAISTCSWMTPARQGHRTLRRVVSLDHGRPLPIDTPFGSRPPRMT